MIGITKGHAHVWPLARTMNAIVACIVLIMFVAVLMERWPQLPETVWRGLRVIARPALTFFVWACVVVAGLSLLMVIMSYPRIEAYCFFYPGIDTRYAPGYSEAAFDKVTNGMTQQAVRQLLGTPF